MPVPHRSRAFSRVGFLIVLAALGVLAYNFGPSSWHTIDGVVAEIQGLPAKFEAVRAAVAGVMHSLAAVGQQSPAAR